MSSISKTLTNSLPQISAAQTSEQSNGASGTAQLDLRGLGAQRTLSLIDGRRLPYGDSSSVAVNIDLVPTNLVERIEVLTGGSSAVYGSDAVAGVVNFILKDDFEGVELDVQYGFAQSGNSGNDIFKDVLTVSQVPIPGSVTDGEEITGSVTFGANLDDGRGNVVGFASYQNRQDIIGADRTGSACTLGGGSTNGFGCVGSSNFRRFNNVADFGATDFFQQEDGSVSRHSLAALLKPLTLVLLTSSSARLNVSSSIRKQIMRLLMGMNSLRTLALQNQHLTRKSRRQHRLVFSSAQLIVITRSFRIL